MKTQMQAASDLPGRGVEFGSGGPVKRRPRRRLPAYTPPTEEELRAKAAEDEAWATAKAAREAEEQQFWVGSLRALADLGRPAPEGSGRRTFANAGCVALILRTIGAQGLTRDEILHVMRRDYRYSFRHVGFLLTRLTGTDPGQHLWFRDEDRRYRLLRA